MDLPILKHLDILIGLAVVMLIASTVVVAVTQYLQSVRSARSQYLRETLTDLVLHLAPRMVKADAVYVAERMLRHPLVGRPRWTSIYWLPWLRRIRAWTSFVGSAAGSSLLPLPKVARGEVILRHEIVGTLLEWAAGQGALAQQDQALAADNPQAKENIRRTQAALGEALNACGVPDPESAARSVRANLVEFERANPGQPAQVWQTQAIVSAGLGDLTGKVFSTYDNAMERVTEFFSLDAKVVACVVGFALCFLTQLDSVGLLQRLSKDESLRTALRAKAEMALKSYEQLSATEIVKREEAEKRVHEAVEELRDPKAAVIPDYFLWNQVAQLKVSSIGSTRNLTLKLDTREFPILLPAGCLENFPHCPAAVVRQVLAPVEVYEEGEALVLVARSPEVSTLALTGDAEVRVISTLTRAWDRVGFCHRVPGVMLSWMLLSLGAPFWYDFLKKLLGLRSILQSKDEAERETRRGEQKEAEAVIPPSALLAAQASPLQGSPAGVVLTREAVLRAAPDLHAAALRTLPANYLVNVEGFVTAGGAGALDKWHRTVQGDFLWDGDVKPVETAVTING